MAKTDKSKNSAGGLSFTKRQAAIIRDCLESAINAEDRGDIDDFMDVFSGEDYKELVKLHHMFDVMAGNEERDKMQDDED